MYYIVDTRKSQFLTVDFQWVDLKETEKKLYAAGNTEPGACPYGVRMDVERTEPGFPLQPTSFEQVRDCDANA